MNDRLPPFLGLCKKAGKLTIGLDPVKSSIALGECRLVVLASDISAHTEKEVRFIAGRFNKKVIKLKQTKDEISYSLGKLAAVVSINDEGFAKKIRSMTAESDREEL